MNNAWLIIVFVISMVYLFAAIVKFKMNPFFSMITASLIIGLCVKIEPGKMVSGITSGFGSVMTSLGIIIVLGGVLGTLLAEAGATDSLAGYMLDKVGEKHAGLAINLTGFLISIPVFFGAAYIVLNPILRVLSRKTKKPVQVYITALSVGLLITHALVIPTPGPMTVASVLNANIGWFIIYSLIVAIPASLIAGWIYGEYLGKKIPYVEPEDPIEDELEKNHMNQAPAQLAILLILIPLFLIVLGTLLPMFFQNKILVSVCSLLTEGNGMISLLISVALAAWLLRPYIKKEYAPLITESFNGLGETVMLLGAGGSFGVIVQYSGIGDCFVELLQRWDLSLYILAALLAVLLRTTLGSSATSSVTTVSIVAPLCAQMGASPVLIGLTICAGSLAFSTPTDASFWIVQKLDNLSIKDTVRCYTAGNAIACTILLVLIFILNMCRGFLPGLNM